jgi:hypothetical protein
MVMPLRCKTVTTIAIDYSDLENFIKEVYGQEYEIPSEEEKGNDCTITYSLKQEPLGDYDERKMGQFCQGKHHGGMMLRTIMQDLVNNGRIIPGNYSIQISW